MHACVHQSEASDEVHACDLVSIQKVYSGTDKDGPFDAQPKRIFGPHDAQSNTTYIANDRLELSIVG
jgi:hypothetical protein